MGDFYDKEINWNLYCCHSTCSYWKGSFRLCRNKTCFENVKDKLKKTGKDFSANCKEVLDATRRVFTDETPDENTITLARETVIF